MVVVIKKEDRKKKGGLLHSTYNTHKIDEQTDR
jgi:hypothetical protein